MKPPKIEGDCPEYLFGLRPAYYFFMVMETSLLVTTESQRDMRPPRFKLNCVGVKQSFNPRSVLPLWA